MYRCVKTHSKNKGCTPNANYGDGLRVRKNEGELLNCTLCVSLWVHFL